MVTKGSTPGLFWLGLAGVVVGFLAVLHDGGQPNPLKDLPLGAGERPREDNRDVEQVRKALSEAGHFELIQRFAERYRAADFEGDFSDFRDPQELVMGSQSSLSAGRAAILAAVSGMDPPVAARRQRGQELNKLCDLIKSKGITVSPGEMRILVIDAINEHEFAKFAKRVCHDATGSFDSYLRNFIVAYGTDIEAHLGKLLRLLRRDGIDDFGLRERLDELQRQMELERFEAGLRAGAPESATLESLDDMTGEEFERWLGHLFQRMGFSVRTTPATGDQGADLVVERLGETAVVQAKRWTSPVGNSAVQEVAAAVGHYRTDRAILVTTSSFTPQARVLAASNNVELVDRVGLERWMRTCV